MTEGLDEKYNNLLPCEDNDCQTAMLNFCRNKNTNKYNNLCDCFRREEVYDDYIDELLRGIPPDQQIIARSLLDRRPQCMFPSCKNNTLSKKPNSQNITCPSNAFQFCINETDIGVGGNINDSKIVPQQTNQCIQQAGGVHTDGNGDGSTTNGDGSTTNGPVNVFADFEKQFKILAWLIITLIVIVIIVGIFVVYT